MGGPSAAVYRSLEPRDLSCVAVPTATSRADRRRIPVPALGEDGEGVLRPLARTLRGLPGPHAQHRAVGAGQRLRRSRLLGIGAWRRSENLTGGLVRRNRVRGVSARRRDALPSHLDVGRRSGHCALAVRAGAARGPSRMHSGFDREEWEREGAARRARERPNLRHPPGSRGAIRTTGRSRRRSVNRRVAKRSARNGRVKGARSSIGGGKPSYTRGRS